MNNNAYICSSDDEAAMGKAGALVFALILPWIGIVDCVLTLFGCDHIIGEETTIADAAIFIGGITAFCGFACVGYGAGSGLGVLFGGVTLMICGAACNDSGMIGALYCMIGGVVFALVIILSFTGRFYLKAWRHLLIILAIVGFLHIYARLFCTTILDSYDKFPRQW